MLLTSQGGEAMNGWGVAICRSLVMTGFLAEWWGIVCVQILLYGHIFKIHAHISKPNLISAFEILKFEVNPPPLFSPIQFIFYLGRSRKELLGNILESFVFMLVFGILSTSSRLSGYREVKTERLGHLIYALWWTARRVMDTRSGQVMWCLGRNETLGTEKWFHLMQKGARSVKQEEEQ